jgi:hypothetical protein
MRLKKEPFWEKKYLRVLKELNPAYKRTKK